MARKVPRPRPRTSRISVTLVGYGDLVAAFRALGPVARQVARYLFHWVRAVARRARELRLESSVSRRPRSSGTRV